MPDAYVSLDIETTGLKPEEDEIIEVACVKFQGERIIDTLSSLVNPDRPLPYRIQVLCGINQDEVKRAPPFSQIASELIQFIQGCSIVGHNVSFDLDFLGRKGLRATNQIFDTRELSPLFLFQVPDHSLASLAKHLGLHTPQHRALDDAVATKELFLALLDRAGRLDFTTIEGIVRFADRASWEMAAFFREAARLKAAGSIPDGAVASPGDSVLLKDEALTPNAEKTCLDIAALSALLGEGGALSRAFPGYECRQEQAQMTEAVARSLNEGKHLMVEAGTGTGKSVAYLLPSILYSVQNNSPVVVSTNTINLQEQLMTKDIPNLVQALGQSALKVSQVKGRSNYLCLRRLASLEANDRLTRDEARMLARLKIWLRSTTTGDRSELNLNGPEIVLWNRLCAQTEERIEARCPFQQKGSCFLHRARKTAQNANLIVVNHALLLTDLIAEAKILPEYRRLVIDEAHHLEEETTRQLGSQVTQWNLLEHLNRFRQEIGGGSIGILPQVDGFLRSSNIAQASKRRFRELTEALDSKVSRARNCLSRFLEEVRDFVEQHISNGGEYDRQLRLTAATRSQPGWPRVESCWEKMKLALEDIADTVNELYLALEDAQGKGARVDHLLTGLSSLFQEDRELCQAVDSIISRPDPEVVSWATVSGESKAVGVFSAPIAVNRFLNESLFGTKESVVLTSATLATQGNLEYLKGRLGLEDSSELVLGSPFDYKRAAMVYVVRDLPEPGNPGYQQGVQKALLAICRAARGRTLVLFTSHSGLRATLSAIQAPLEQDGILVLGQGVNGSPRQLMTALKTNQETVILGAASLWEGVDIVGEALSVLVMARLPFNVPSDPVFAARCELAEDAFNRYAVPQAVLRFKQGFGRLIRSKTDRGVMVVLDSRLCRRQYGPVFLDSIPGCALVQGPSANLPAAVQQWLNNGQVPGGFDATSVRLHR